VHALDILRARFSADEDDVLARVRALDRFARGERELPDDRAGRRGQALREDRCALLTFS